MLRMSEVNEVDHQSMQHMLTEGCVDWQGFGWQIAQEANELLDEAAIAAEKIPNRLNSNSTQCRVR
jgi:hypothetical protein